VKGKIQSLESRAQTGTEIYQSAAFYPDLGNHIDTTLTQFFNFVKNIPYIEDMDRAELISRPKYLLHRRNFAGLDCKKKATLIGAWLNAHGLIPGKDWHLVAISERPDKEIHHVFVQARFNKQWKNLDPTYPEYKIFDPKPNVTNAEILLP